MSLILCGMPGSGKTTVGRMLANKLQRPFFDTDALIEERYAIENNVKLSCREITKQYGEIYFRNLEESVIKTLLSHKDCCSAIIATGGGALLCQENAFHLKSIGLLIYLKTQPNILLSRILYSHGSKSSPDPDWSISIGLPAYLNPSDPEGSFLELYHFRDPIYDASCHFTFDVSNYSIESVVKTLSKKFDF